ncbi:MAG: helix-turn-helix transcriptional regulator [Limisphaerales bacterium]
MGARSLFQDGHEQWLSIARTAGYCVDTVARQCGISTRQLFRIFVAEMNCSPKKWFKRRQLELGYSVLMRTGCVKIAAYECGYSQVPNFCRDFKKEFGCSAGHLLQLRHPVDLNRP